MSARPSFGSTTIGVEPGCLERRRRVDHARRPRPQSSPDPGAPSRRAASGARSPEAPSEPCSGTHGTMPASSSASSALTSVDPHPRQPGGQGARAQQDHAAHHLVVETRAGPRGMADHDRALEERATRRVDGAVGERAEPGGHPVHDRALAIEALDRFAPRRHPPGDRRVEGHRLASASGAHHRIDRQRAAVDCDHAASSLLDPEAVERPRPRTGEERRTLCVRGSAVTARAERRAAAPAPPPWPPAEGWQPPRPWPGAAAARTERARAGERSRSLGQAAVAAGRARGGRAGHGDGRRRCRRIRSYLGGRVQRVAARRRR